MAIPGAKYQNTSVSKQPLDLSISNSLNLLTIQQLKIQISGPQEPPPGQQLTSILTDGFWSQWIIKYLNTTSECAGKCDPFPGLLLAH